MQFAVSKIKPNPFRHIDRYPIRRDKVTALRESMETTGFWENVVARRGPNGTAEIAYGHHRLEALKQEFGSSDKVELIVRDLSDEQMLQIMARENMEEWGTSAAIEHETVRAVVEAYADGKIGLPDLARDANLTGLRYAPSFVPNERSADAAERPYAVVQVAQFLGWMKPSGEAQEKVGNALSALQFIEEGILKESDFEELSGSQAAAVVEEARRARAERERAARAAEREAEEARKAAARAEKERAAAVKREAEAQTKRERERARLQRERAEKERREQEAKEKARAKAAQEQRARGDKNARTAGRAVSGAIKKGTIGTRQARTTARKALGDETREAQPIPNAEAFMRRLAQDLHRVLDPDHDPRTDKLDELVKALPKGLPGFELKDLIATLELVGGRFDTYARKLKARPAAKTTQRQLTSGRRS